MADEEKPDEAFDRPSRFPAAPAPANIPVAPKVEVKLPPHPDTPQKGSVVPGGHQKLAVAATAASSFVTPIIVLGAGGWYLDQKLHHQIALLAFAGTLLGFIVGIMALLRVIQQLSR
jgi:hypothetical protein